MHVFVLSALFHESASVTEFNPPHMNELVLSLMNDNLAIAHSSEQVDRMTGFVLPSSLPRQDDQPHSGVLSGQDRVLRLDPAVQSC